MHVGGGTQVGGPNGGTEPIGNEGEGLQVQGAGE